LSQSTRLTDGQMKTPFSQLDRPAFNAEQ